MRGRRRTPRLRAPRPRLLGRVASASVSAGANVSSVISSEADRHPVGDSQQRSLCLPGISSGIGHGLEFPVESAMARDSFCESRPPGHRGGLRGSPSGAPPGQWGLGRKTRRPSVALSVTHTGKCRGGGGCQEVRGRLQLGLGVLLWTRSAAGAWTAAAPAFQALVCAPRLCRGHRSLQELQG